MTEHFTRFTHPVAGMVAFVAIMCGLFWALFTLAAVPMDLIEAVIGLGPNLFYGTSLAACVLVFRQRKVKERRNVPSVEGAITRNGNTFCVAPARSRSA